jgi:hypothetical protein
LMAAHSLERGMCERCWLHASDNDQDEKETA